MNAKICKKCNKEKPLTEFELYKRKESNRTYANGFCKPCEKVRQKTYYEKNKEKISRKFKREYQKNKLKGRLKSKQSYKKYKKWHNNYTKKYYATHKNKLLKQSKKRRMSPHGIIIRNRYYKTVTYRFNQYKHGARARGIAWNLSKEQFITFWKKSCSYCKAKIETIGLDRIKSDKKIGYRLGNIVPCCAGCNYFKCELSRDKFILMCKKIARVHRRTL